MRICWIISPPTLMLIYSYQDAQFYFPFYLNLPDDACLLRVTYPSFILQRALHMFTKSSNVASHLRATNLAAFNPRHVGPYSHGIVVTDPNFLETATSFLTRSVEILYREMSSPFGAKQERVPENTLVNQVGRSTQLAEVTTCLKARTLPETKGGSSRCRQNNRLKARPNPTTQTRTSC